MSHNIFGKRFLSTREPAWHGIGQSWTGPKTAVAAVAESGVGQIVIGTRRMGWQTEDGTFEPVDDRVVIVRQPTPDDPQVVRLGEAGTDYTVLQNTEIARALDQGGLTQRWPVETCGALGRGETLFVCLAMGQDTVAGEDHARYALVWDKRDGRSSLQVVTCYTRVVCQNTLNIALSEKDAEIKLSLEHNPTIAGDFRFSLDVIDQVEAQSARVKDALERLQAIKVTADDLPAVWNAAYPAPTKGTLLRQYERIDDPVRFDPAQLARLEKMSERWQYEHGWKEALRDAASERYDVLCQEYPHLAGTGLGVLNTVAEIADHTRNTRDSGASILGFRADEKIRTYRHLLTLDK